MSFFTKADAEYTRLEAFIDGCTMMGDKHADS